MRPTYKWNLKYKTIECIYEIEKDTDIEKRLVVAKGEGGRDWDFGISGCKLLYIGWILYGTGNYIQYPMVNHNGKEKEYLYVKLNDSAIQQKLTQHCK